MEQFSVALRQCFYFVLFLYLFVFIIPLMKGTVKSEKGERLKRSGGGGLGR